MNEVPATSRTHGLKRATGFFADGHVQQLFLSEKVAADLHGMITWNGGEDVRLP